MPRLVEALVGKKVMGAAAGANNTVVRFTFGQALGRRAMEGRCVHICAEVLVEARRFGRLYAVPRSMKSGAKAVGRALVPGPVHGPAPGVGA